jgi:hypothetical protein
MGRRRYSGFSCAKELHYEKKKEKKSERTAQK